MIPDPLSAVLDADEKLLWSGQPKQGVRLQARDVFMIPFSLLWGGFAIFWEVMAIGITLSPKHPAHHAGEPFWATLIFPLFGLPFVVVGLYIIFGRFFYDAAQRRKTYYGITNRRVIILKTLFFKNTSSFDYPTLGGLNLTERGDGSGDILFGTPSIMSSFAGGGWPSSGRYVVPGFYLLPGARQVYNLIRDAQRAAK